MSKNINVVSPSIRTVLSGIIMYMMNVSALKGKLKATLSGSLVHRCSCLLKHCRMINVF